MSPENTPTCSICIANYNGEKYISACIDSILSQSFECPVEIIIHDDASTDNSVSLIQSKYPQVKLITSQKNLGFCQSNNRMVENARGTFILLLNNDAMLHEDALETMYSASQQYGDAILGLPQYDANTHELIDRGSIFDPFLNPIPNKDIARQDVGMVIGACLWLPKDLWNKLGGFPEWFGSLAEDMYICCLARLWEYPVKALSKSGFDHWVGRSLGGGKVTKNKKLSTTSTRRALSERNKTFVMLICYPTPALFCLFPLHICLLCLEGIILSLLKQDKNLWTNIYWNCIVEINNHKTIIKETRQFASNRKMTDKHSFYFFKSFVFTPHKLRLLIKHGLPTIKAK